MLGPKDRTDLKSVSDFNSTWADRVAYLILAGLLVDIAVLFIPKGWSKIAASIGANLLIFGGVWGELWFAKRAREADDGRVAEANARANEAALALEKFRARRRLEDEGNRLCARLEKFTGTSFAIALTNIDDEIMGISSQIAFCLMGIGWVMVDWPYPAPGRSQLPVFPSASVSVGNLATSDVLVSFPMGNGTMEEAAKALADALNAEDVTTSWAPTVPDGRHVLLMFGPKR